MTTDSMRKTRTEPADNGMARIVAHLRLMRPANIVTAVADILAGFAICGAAGQVALGAQGGVSPSFSALLWLCLSTVGLYGGGIVFNDVFDADLDSRERPERPIPCGLASVASAGTLAILLLAAGIGAAFIVSPLSGIIAAAVASLAVTYDAWGKHRSWFGPVNMGLCRGGNLLLGASAVPAALADVWPLGLVPVVYIAAVTTVSRGEVHGGNRRALAGGAALYLAVLAALVTLAVVIPTGWQAAPFVLLLAALIFPPLARAWKTLEPHLVGKAVKAGVLSLIVLNSTLAGIFAGWQYGIMVLALLPLSLWLAKMFAVT
ncbi:MULTISPECIES: UbiA-like protein EboC [unclassified Microbulbifer]|uniref:UbiA-like protein EboC n=1 Tax=unclassified Microbulbifer TaxID=2619833 RepID=UPI0027E3EC86|nr:MULTISPECIES: UbiA-like protein EboC [unclassified Microbulbifer]